MYSSFLCFSHFLFFDAGSVCVSRVWRAGQPPSYILAREEIYWDRERALGRGKQPWPGDTMTWKCYTSWWRHQMGTFSASLALCAGNSPVTGEFPTQRPVTRSFDVFFELCLNKRLGKQSWGWWFKTPSDPLWRHCDVLLVRYKGNLLVISLTNYRLIF